MLNNLKLLYRIDAVKEAILASTSGLQVKSCWSDGKIKTVHISAVFNGKELNAWGADKNESIALSKSLMELAERIHLKQSPVEWINLQTMSRKSHADMVAEFDSVSHFLATSSGLAAHLSRNEAVSNSLNEIIERHTITKALFENISPSLSTVEQYVWQGPLNRHVTLSRVKLDQYGYLYGSSANASLKSALKRSSEELSALRCWSENPANLSSFMSSTFYEGPSSVQRYHLDNPPELEFLGRRGSGMVSVDIPESTFWIADIPLLPAFFQVESFCVVRSFCPMLQPLGFSKLLDGYINPLAIDLSKINPKVQYNVVA